MKKYSSNIRQNYKSKFNILTYRKKGKKRVGRIIRMEERVRKGQEEGKKKN